MGRIELRTAFNEMAEPFLTCSEAFHEYVREHDVEWQLLTFRGTSATGEPFEIKSRLIRPGEEVNDVARETARQFVDRGKSV